MIYHNRTQLLLSSLPSDYKILCYLPNQNGKWPSHSYQESSKKGLHKWNPAQETHYGQLYHSHGFFMENIVRLNNLKQRSKEKRDNLRKVGDNPAAN